MQIAQSTWVTEIGAILIRSDDGVDTVYSRNDLRRCHAIGINCPTRNFDATGTDSTRTIDNAIRIATKRLAPQQRVTTRTNVDTERADLFRS